MQLTPKRQGAGLQTAAVPSGVATETAAKFLAAAVAAAVAIAAVVAAVAARGGKAEAAHPRAAGAQTGWAHQVQEQVAEEGKAEATHSEAAGAQTRWAQLMLKHLGESHREDSWPGSLPCARGGHCSRGSRPRSSSKAYNTNSRCRPSTRKKADFPIPVARANRAHKASTTGAVEKGRKKPRRSRPH